MLTVVPDLSVSVPADGPSALIDQIVREGARRRAEPRTVQTSAGAVEVTVPRVNDKRTDRRTGERRRFSWAVLPSWARKTPQVTEVLPLPYLHGTSSGDFVSALGQEKEAPA